jgi:hypothetical protein
VKSDRGEKPRPQQSRKDELKRIWRVFEYRRPVPARARFTT